MNIDINPADKSSVSRAIKTVAKYQRWLKSCTKDLLDRMTQEGFEVASAGFMSSQYAGTNDASVTFQKKGKYTRAIVATGASVLFIEFGTGIFNPDDHPEKPAGIVGHGEYGSGRGSSPRGWFYKGDVGSNPPPGTAESTKRPGLVHTVGNIANKPMYYTERQLEARFSDLVRETFVWKG